MTSSATWRNVNVEDVDFDFSRRPDCEKAVWEGARIAIQQLRRKEKPQVGNGVQSTVCHSIPKGSSLSAKFGYEQAMDIHERIGGNLSDSEAEIFKELGPDLGLGDL